MYAHECRRAKKLIPVKIVHLLRRNQVLVGSVQEVLVEGRQPALNQWVGRTSQNKVLNFTVPEGSRDRNRLGSYA